MAGLALLTSTRAASSIDLPGVQNGQSSSVTIGTATVDEARPTKTFVVRNLGKSKLTIGKLTVPSGFVLSKSPDSTVGAGKETAFVIELSTAKVGKPSGTVVIPNNTPGKNPFKFPISGEVKARSKAPDIDVVGVVNHQTRPIEFGTVLQGRVAPSVTFTLKNTGASTLKLGKTVVPSGFVLLRSPAASVKAGAQTLFTVGLDPARVGTFSGKVVLPSNDPDENPFDFIVRGVVLADDSRPEISVLVNGKPYAASANELFRTWAFVGQSSGNPVVISLRNEGKANLVISDWTLSAGFVTTPAIPVTLRPGNVLEVRILPTTQSLAVRTGTLRFRTNDADEPLFNLKLRGIAFEPVKSDNRSNAISTFPDGQVTIYSTPGMYYSIEPANALMPWNGAYVIRSYDRSGRLVSRLTYDSLLRRVVIYQNGSASADNWTNLLLEMR